MSEPQSATVSTNPASELDLSAIRVVLVHTSHSGNIGAAARAMKTMGLSDLALVSPKEFPSEEATARSSGAQDLLENARVVENLDDAIADCGLVVGASARSRSLPWPMLDPRQLADRIADHPAGSKIALLFGRERSGLTNEELARCHYHVNIPANPDYSSLNLAQAVQVLAYELRMRSLDQEPRPAGPWGVEWDQPPANADQLEGLFQAWEKTLVEVDFLDPTNPRTLMNKVRRLILRAQPDEVEANILRGFLTQVDKSLRKR
ncbi:tRNA (cytosine(32)/uridine(32)-2'-O)-methyltransferase TrmJ [Saccharospirillum sp. HFRX-1]|uniref:tRNA (cytosine(32)/uridine(32)-2'-O)-methyltransferase TrmJ n=1 Tax=unclassified Saccharospirillum TaxID=2633430 RepID=UPI00371604CF